MPKALQIDPRDNVAVVLSDIKSGDLLTIVTEKGVMEITANTDIIFGHKIALANFNPDQPILKYGEEIGKSLNPIQRGDWVHLHNVYCERGHKD